MKFVLYHCKSYYDTENSWNTLKYFPEKNESY